MQSSVITQGLNIYSTVSKSRRNIKEEKLKVGTRYSRSLPSCKLCKGSPETVRHIVTGCKIQAGTLHTERHVAGIVHKNIGVSKSQWQTSLTVFKNNGPGAAVQLARREQKTTAVIEVPIPAWRTIRRRPDALNNWSGWGR